MKQPLKLFSILCAGALLGCAQMPPKGTPDFARTSPAAALDADSLFVLGRAAHGAGDFALALQRYRQVLKQQPNHVGAINSMAVIYAQTERADQAMALFQQALDIDPKAAYVHNNLGYTLLRLGQFDHAQQELEFALKLNPSSSQTRKNLELLSSDPRLATATDSAKSLLGEVPAHDGKPLLVSVGPNVVALQDWPAAPGAARPAARTDDPLKGVRIEVSNGVGIRHLARDTAARLAPWGVVTARLTNEPSYSQSRTEIQFAAGQKGAADALSARLPVGVRVTASDRMGRSLQMRLVLGRDLVGKTLATWLESGSERSLALATHDGWRWA